MNQKPTETTAAENCSLLRPTLTAYAKIRMQMVKRWETTAPLHLFFHRKLRFPSFLLPAQYNGNTHRQWVCLYHPRSPVGVFMFSKCVNILARVKPRWSNTICLFSVTKRRHHWYKKIKNLSTPVCARCFVSGSHQWWWMCRWGFGPNANGDSLLFMWEIMCHAAKWWGYVTVTPPMGGTWKFTLGIRIFFFEHF